MSLQAVLAAVVIAWATGCATSPPKPVRANNQPDPVRQQQMQSMEEMLNPSPNR